MGDLLGSYYFFTARETLWGIVIDMKDDVVIVHCPENKLGNRVVEVQLASFLRWITENVIVKKEETEL